jgi:hypothetical protein
MFQFLLGVLIFASNFLGVSRASAEMGSGPNWVAPAVTAASTPFCQTATPIKTLDDLRTKVGTTGNYCLANDIDASLTSTTPFRPIGSSNPFTGIFDGNGHVINKLTIAAATNNGLFAQVGSTGIVRNVGITDSTIGQPDGTGEFQGGLLVGINDGVVTNCFATGTAAPAASSGGGTPSVGGLIGANNGSLTNSHATVVVQVGSNSHVIVAGGLVGINYRTITQSYASGQVSNNSGIGDSGGFVGNNLGTIEQSYATGNVSSVFRAGGFVALQYREGKILQSYATGSVSSSIVGGFAGYNDSSTISQSYSVGLVTGSGSVGGFLGRDVGGTYTSDYWDVQTSGQSNDGAATGTTGLTTAQLKASLPSGFDPAVWGIVPSITYPYLLWQNAFTLSSFPLKDTKGNFLTPYNAPIITVFDHSMENRRNSGVVGLYKCDGEVLAFTGDPGLSSNGSFGKYPNDKKCADALGYENSSKTSFTLGRVVNYTGAAHFGGSFYLNYDGHPGYDYAADNGTPVFAAVTGKISYPWNAVGMTTRNYDAYCYWHALALHPDNNANYIIYYLHLLTHPNNDLQRLIGLGCRASSQAARAVSFTPQPGCYKDSSGNPFMPTTLPLPEGTHVMSGCEIAHSGQAGVPGSPHLHFEVQQIFEANQVSPTVQNHPQLLECLANEKVSDSDRDAAHFCLPMDPYGWAPTPANCSNPGQCPDPYQFLTGVPARKLWAQ